MATAANQCWVSNITYLPSRISWLYLTGMLDLYSRVVVCWSLSTFLSHESVRAALHKAVWKRNPAKDLLLHSDRGVQYACHAFRKALMLYKMEQSMSRKGNCRDNAVSESFYRSLKTEMISDLELINVDHPQNELFE